MKVSAATSAILATGNAILFISPDAALANEAKPIQLLKPNVSSANPLMRLLEKRSSSREFSPEKLPLEVISRMLWAAFGINRTDSGNRTAPSARNRQEIDICVATADGLYLFDAKANRLNPILEE